MTEYQEQGFENRRAYLLSLCDEFGLEPETVFMLASMLGPSEDFDGLICALEDSAEELGS